MSRKLVEIGVFIAIALIAYVVIFHLIPEPAPKTTPETTVVPAPEPTSVPAVEPTAVPTAESTPEPIPEPTLEPTLEPTSEPMPEPTEDDSGFFIQPSTDVTPEPTVVSTVAPTAVPTAEPTPEPTAESTEEPTPEPTEEPTHEPTPEPTLEPTPESRNDYATIRAELDCLTCGGGVYPSYEDAPSYDLYNYISVEDMGAPELFESLTKPFMNGIASWTAMQFSGSGTSALSNALNSSVDGNCGRVRIGDYSGNNSEMSRVFDEIRQSGDYATANSIMLDWLYRYTAKNPANPYERWIIACN